MHCSTICLLPNLCVYANSDNRLKLDCLEASSDWFVWTMKSGVGMLVGSLLTFVTKKTFSNVDGFFPSQLWQLSHLHSSVQFTPC